ncbi:MAG: LysR family transcriptional regulator [Lachnospiraceae bacterium]|nr:LysR family transcriptional regulator [Lachnospiraceae bacterium]
MNQRQLEIFTTLAATLNFTETAEQLYLSQTTVTLQIHNLEEELKVKLFDRTSRSVSLTYAGEVFLEGAKEILDDIQKTVDATTYAGQGYRGKIKIGFADDVNATGIADMVRTFSEQHPEIRFHVSGGYPGDLINTLLAEENDLILIPSFSGVSSNKLNYHRLGSYRSVAAFHKNHPFAKKRKLKFKDFENENYIYTSGYEAVLDFTGEFLHQLEQADVHVNVVARTDNIDAVFFMLDANLGFSILPEYFIGRFSGSSNIKVCPIDEPLKPTDFFAVWKTKKQTQAMEQFLAFLKEYYPE